MSVYIVLSLVCLAFICRVYGDGENHVIQDGSKLQVIDRELVLSLMGRLESLEKQNIAQQAMIEDGQIKLSAQAAKMAKLEGKLARCTQSTDNQDLTKNRASRQISGDTVAFTAIASSGVDHYGAGNQDIPFEHVDLNVGNAYDPSQGTFVPQVSGIYVISVTILSVADRETSCDLVVNGIARARIYARGSDGRHGQGSQTVALHLEKGDSVSVRNEAADDAVQGGLYTSFSGFRLPEEPSTSNIIG